MKISRTLSMPYRRKREGKTNYKKRLKILLSSKPRLVVRKSLNNILFQIISYDAQGDKVVISSHSKELEKQYGWKFNKGNLPTAYLAGLLIGQKAKKQNITSVVVDLGMYPSIKSSRLYAGLKGALDGGLSFICGEEMVPSDERISGKHIADYATSLKENNDAYTKQFSRYIKDGVDPTQLPKDFENIKNKILGAEK